MVHVPGMNSRKEGDLVEVRQTLIDEAGIVLSEYRTWYGRLVYSHAEHHWAVINLQTDEIERFVQIWRIFTMPVLLQLAYQA